MGCGGVSRKGRLNGDSIRSAGVVEGGKGVLANPFVPLSHAYISQRYSR